MVQLEGVNGTEQILCVYYTSTTAKCNRPIQCHGPFYTYNIPCVPLSFEDEISCPCYHP
jgi:hypothetical protein